MAQKHKITATNPFQAKRALELTHLQRPGKPVQPALQALQPWGAEGVTQV